MSKERRSAQLLLVENEFLRASAVIQLPKLLQQATAQSIGRSLWQQRDEVDVFAEATQYFELTKPQYIPNEVISPDAALYMKAETFTCFLTSIKVYMQQAEAAGEEVNQWEQQLVDRLFAAEQVADLVNKPEVLVQQELSQADYCMQLWFHILEAMRREHTHQKFVLRTVHAIMTNLFKFTLQTLQQIDALQRSHRDKKYRTLIQKIEQQSQLQLGRFIPSFGAEWGTAVHDNPQVLHNVHDQLIRSNSELTVLQVAAAVEIIEGGLQAGKSELSMWRLFSIMNPDLSKEQVNKNKQWWRRKFEVYEDFRESTFIGVLEKSTLSDEEKYELWVFLVECNVLPAESLPEFQ